MEQLADLPPCPDAVGPGAWLLQLLSFVVPGASPKSGGLQSSL